MNTPTDAIQKALEPHWLEKVWAVISSKATLLLIAGGLAIGLFMGQGTKDNIKAKAVDLSQAFSAPAVPGVIVPEEPGIEQMAGASAPVINPIPTPTAPAVDILPAPDVEVVDERLAAAEATAEYYKSKYLTLIEENRNGESFDRVMQQDTEGLGERLNVLEQTMELKLQGLPINFNKLTEAAVKEVGLKLANDPEWRVYIEDQAAYYLKQYLKTHKHR